MSSSAASAMGGADEPISASSIVAEAVTGSHVLKITGYSKTKALRNGEFIKSRTFDVGGLRWYIRYYPHGRLGYAGWILFRLNLYTDAEAGIKKASFQLHLLDEMEVPVQPYSMSGSLEQSIMNGPSVELGLPRFIQKAALEESAYLKYDCFRVRCDMTVSREDNTAQFVMVPVSDMHQHIGRLLSSAQETDVTFHVGEETVAAHRLVLGARSSVFMAELFGPMKERHASHTQIRDMEPRVFRAMLHFIYTDTMPDIDKEDALVMTQHLLVAADRYDLERLKLICEDKLCRYIDASTVATTLAIAEQHGCHGLKKACFKFLQSPNHLKEVMADEGFDHLMSSCPSVIMELLTNVAHCP